MVRIICPECKGIDFKKAGIALKSHRRKAQRYQCKDCGRFVNVEIVEVKAE
jgi:transposase-like protein